MSFKAGQIVRCKVRSTRGSFAAGGLYTVVSDNGLTTEVEANNYGIPDAFVSRYFEAVGYTPIYTPLMRSITMKNETITLGVRPSLADDLNLHPNDRKVLAHLSSGNTLTKLEAQSVYGNWSIAGSVFRLREAGYKVRTQLCRDATGHRYARYSLAA